MTSLITEKKPKSCASEAYRVLRTNIQFSSFDKELNTIVVTSPASFEGKSTVTSNLAFTMAQADKRVLVIDCDFRRPSIYKKFGISNRVGLTNLLIEDVKLDDVIVQYNRNLFIIPAGLTPPNPSEMLGSKKMKDLLEVLRGIFNYIILDTPPVMAVTDAQILSSMADGVIIVVAYNQTSKGALSKTKELLNNVKANIIGTVFNKVKIKSGNNYAGKYCYK